MIFYLRDAHLDITKDTKPKAYDLNIQEYGSTRKTLSNGDLIKIRGVMYEVVDYEYSYVHEKGVHLIVEYSESFYLAEEVIDDE